MSIVLGNNNFSTTSNTIKPFATWFAAGSIGQRQGRNPALRVYKYDRIDNKLLNYYQYRMDTNQSNIKNKPIWFKAYDAMSEYDMIDISAQSMTELAYKLQINDTYWQRFEYNYYNGIYHSKALNRNSTVCDLLSVTNEQYKDCKDNLFLSSMSAETYQSLYWYS